MWISCSMCAWYSRLLPRWYISSIIDDGLINTLTGVCVCLSVCYREEHPSQHVLLLWNGRPQLSEDICHRVPQLQQTPDEPYLPERYQSWFVQLHASGSYRLDALDPSIIEAPLTRVALLLSRDLCEIYDGAQSEPSGRSKQSMAPANPSLTRNAVGGANRPRLSRSEQIATALSTPADPKRP